MILLNNQGGGIFRILPGDKTDSNFEYFFETPHKLTAEHFCKMYNINYQLATNLTDLQRKIGEFYEKSDVPKLLEVHTPRKINDKVFVKIFFGMNTKKGLCKVSHSLCFSVILFYICLVRV